MRELILGGLQETASRQKNLNILRENLQLLLLKILHESQAGAYIAFTGGTFLRLLHQLPRYSEDLDFSLVQKDYYDFPSLIEHIRLNFERLNLPVDLKEKSGKTLHQLYIRFREILAEGGLSHHRDEKLPIRLEIDTNPPQGWQTEFSMISGIYLTPVLHFDLPSAFATKLHACLFRRYVKGRDFYDLMWYLGKKIRPNFTVLNNAIAQTETEASILNNNDLKQRLLDKIDAIDATYLQKDVAPFLIHPKETDLLNPQLLHQVIAHYSF